jgi:hypothetical protein
MQINCRALLVFLLAGELKVKAVFLGRVFNCPFLRTIARDCATKERLVNVVLVCVRCKSVCFDHGNDDVEKVR